MTPYIQSAMLLWLAPSVLTYWRNVNRGTQTPKWARIGSMVAAIWAVCILIYDVVKAH